MKKILEMFGEPITYGGQESVVYNMLSTFDLKNDFNIDLFTPYFVDNKELLKLINNNDGNVYSLNNVFKTDDNRFLLADCVNDFFSKNHDYDVVHIHSGSLTTMLVYSKLAKRHRIKKVIVHSHITNPNHNFSFFIRRLILNILLKPYVYYYFGCSTDALKSKFLFINEKNSKVIYNGINVDKFKFNEKNRNLIRKEYNIVDKFVIGSIGRICKQKNNKLMIDLLTEIKDNNVVLMMVGDGEDLNLIKEYAKENNVTDKIIFTGNKTNPQDFYQAFDVFIMPSIFEGMPVTTVEAQISGLPCLLSSNITKDCNISETTYFLPINDIVAWVNKFYVIKELYKNGFMRGNKKLDFFKFNRKLTFKFVDNIYKYNN